MSPQQEDIPPPEDTPPLKTKPQKPSTEDEDVKRRRPQSEDSIEDFVEWEEYRLEWVCEKNKDRRMEEKIDQGRQEIMDNCYTLHLRGMQIALLGMFREKNCCDAKC